MTEEGRRAAADKLRGDGAHEEAIRAFESAYERLTGGAQALVPSAELEPAADATALEDLPRVDGDGVAEILGAVALIKLNGGLATSMGLQQPKSLMEARQGHTFLDIIVGQTLALRARYAVTLPLLLMDSEATREPTLKALAEHAEVATEGLEPDFMQSMIPKLDAETLAPVAWPAAPALEWCPPGHGDVYGALRRSGMLAALRARGIRYAMISNSDNLGAQLDPRVPAHMAARELPFLMEVVLGTEADRKGGHLARRRADGQLILRESAQTAPDDEASFRDYRRWRYYNTNNLWVDLDVLDATLQDNGGVLQLPLIVNRKTVDPRDPGSTPVIQLESAMGAAIESFPGAELLLVPRTRFAPVKTTDDLLVLRSDVYSLSGEMTVEPIPERAGDLPYVELDKRFYRIIDAFEARFPGGAPSLREAQRLVVAGDITFEGGVIVHGAVSLQADAPRRITAGTVLEQSGVTAAEPGGGPITIILAEDHRVVRAGLRLLLDGQPGFAVVAETTDVASTERRVGAQPPDVLVLDVDMPDGSSIPAIPRIRAAAPHTRIVVLTMHTDPSLARDALRAGATGFVPKEATEAELIDAIRAVAAGRTYLNPDLGARMAAERTGPPDDLSPRELEVLGLIALGHTNGEIASQLYLSVRTVESHRAHIQQKTQRSSRAELVAYAREHGIV